MNVLITIPSLYGKGGVSNYYRTILPFLRETHEDNICHIEIGSIKRSQKYFHFVNDQLKFYKKIKNSGLDLIHVNPSLDLKSIIRDSLFILWAKKKKIPVLVFFRGWNVSLESLFKSRVKEITGKLLLNADSYIVLSKSFKKKLKEWGVKVPIHIEATIVDDKLLNNFSIDEKINMLKKSRRVKILFLARIEKDKGIFETIDTLNILLKRGHSVFLSIAGDGTAVKAAKNYLSKKNCLQNANFLGYIRDNEKKYIFSTHHIYCFPTKHGEGMPNSVLEAMAFGMPIVTNPVGGIKNFFKEGIMGYLIKKNDPEVIANLIERLILDKAKMEIIALHNHKYAKENFLASKAAMRIKQIYKKMILI